MADKPDDKTLVLKFDQKVVILEHYKPNMYIQELCARVRRCFWPGEHGELLLNFDMEKNSLHVRIFGRPGCKDYEDLCVLTMERLPPHHCVVEFLLLLSGGIPANPMGVKMLLRFILLGIPYIKTQAVQYLLENFFTFRNQLGLVPDLVPQLFKLEFDAYGPSFEEHMLNLIFRVFTELHVEEDQIYDEIIAKIVNSLGCGNSKTIQHAALTLNHLARQNDSYRDMIGKGTCLQRLVNVLTSSQLAVDEELLRAVCITMQGLLGSVVNKVRALQCDLTLTGNAVGMVLKNYEPDFCAALALLSARKDGSVKLVEGHGVDRLIEALLKEQSRSIWDLCFNALQTLWEPEKHKLKEVMKNVSDSGSGLTRIWAQDYISTEEYMAGSHWKDLTGG